MSTENEIREDELFLLLQSTHRMVLRYHPQVGHLFVPNLRARIPSERGGYFVVTNSQGFRSAVEFAPQRGERPRILFFGDSFTAGDGCSNEERFSDLIGEALDAEVYNYAVSGTGTDQQLLIHRSLAREVEADLILLCIWVENIERIQLSHRTSLDRTSGRRVLVPKPYFTLAGDELTLCQVPVPRRRLPAEDEDRMGKPADPVDRHSPRLAGRLRRIYREHPALRGLGRRLQERLPGLWTRMLRSVGSQPYEDYLTPESPGWRLMRAILERFLTETRPTPTIIVPLPEYRYYHLGAEPRYQGMYESLGSPADGVHVADVTSPLCRMERGERRRLAFTPDPHLSPFGHRKVAEVLLEEIRGKGLLPAPRRAPARRPAGGRRADPRPTYILGLSCFYHDSAASLVKDGQIVAAAEEERFTRVKNDRRFPHHAANYCLEEGGIQQHDLAAVVYYDQVPLTFERLMHTELVNGPGGKESWMRVLPSWVRYKLHLPQLLRRYLRYEGLLLHDLHHRSHAASAFYPSPFTSAATLTVDGVGEWATASIGRGEGNEIRLLREMHFPHSLGLLYSAFTQFTGFRINHGEYKMMGLAPYGEPRFVDLIREHLVDLKEDGSLELNLKYFAFLSDPAMTNDEFAGLFGGPARRAEERITRREMDIARSIQVITEESLLRMARYAHELTGEKNLCLAGGVALNCVANGRLLREGPFARLWIQPAAGDAGCALGAALDVYHTYFNHPRTPPSDGRSLQRGSFLGPAFSPEEIQSFLETHGYPYRRLATDDRAATLASLLTEGKVLGHFAGRTEFGPRALGARSILADPRNQEMQANLNLKIKYRESFRPFAPTVLAERVQDYFELAQASPYMLLVAPVRSERRTPFELELEDGDLLRLVRKPRSDVPAITHVDYSARVQTILREDHPSYYDLIKAFEERTGCAVVVNTSFNVRGEPIVCAPYDAYRCFMRTEMDVLVLGDFLLEKKDQPPWPERKGHVEEPTEPPPPLEEDAFARELRAVFTRRFLPLTGALRRDGGGRVSLPFTRDATRWVDHAEPETREALFVIHPEMDRPDPRPAEMARALLGYWSPSETTRALRPVVEDLLALGIRFQPSLPDRLDEEVPESIYVLY